MSGSRPGQGHAALRAGRRLLQGGGVQQLGQQVHAEGRHYLPCGKLPCLMTQVAQYAAQLENYTKAIQIYEQVNYSWNSLDSVYHLYFSQFVHAYNISCIPRLAMHTLHLLSPVWPCLHYISYPQFGHAYTTSLIPSWDMSTINLLSPVCCCCSGVEPAQVQC